MDWLTPSLTVLALFLYSIVVAENVMSWDVCVICEIWSDW